MSFAYGSTHILIGLFQALEYARKIRDDRGKAMIVVVGQGEERNDMTEEELEVCVTFIVRAHLVSTKLVSSPTVFYNMSIKTTLSSIPSANAEGEIWHMTKTCVMYFSAIIN